MSEHFNGNCFEAFVEEHKERYRCLKELGARIEAEVSYDLRTSEYHRAAFNQEVHRIVSECLPE